tara:strand:+ start:4170 stop:4298 length:129 start_codon:yes stop_codon:yes gene_type:complete
MAPAVQAEPVYPLSACLCADKKQAATILQGGPHLRALNGERY